MDKFFGFNKLNLTGLKPIPEREHNVKYILERYPDRIPIYVRTTDNLPELDKQKYLVPKDITVGQFLYVCRKRMQLAPEKGLFIFFSDILPSTNNTIEQIYDKYKEKSGLLIATLSSENTFG